MTSIRGPRKTAVSGVRVFWGTSSEETFRRRDPRTAAYSHGRTQRQPESLERRLRNVMAIAPADHGDVNRRPEMNRESLPEFLQHLRLERAHASAQRHVVREVGTLAQADDHTCERFVEGRIRRCEPRDAGAVSHRLRQRLAQYDARVLDEVMRVDVHVARTAKREVEASLARHLLDHVVADRQPGRDLDSAAALKDDLRRQLRLLALAHDLRRSYSPTQGGLPRRARARSALPGPPGAASRPEASRDRHGS